MEKNIPQDEFLKKRKLRQKKLRKRRMKILFVFVLILSLLLGIILSLTVFFPIKNLKVTGSKIYESNEILQASGIESGDNLFAVSRKKAEKNIKQKLPFIETIEFQRSMPNTLVIKVYDAKEYVAYKYKNAYYSVSKSGWVMKKYNKLPNDVCTVIGVNATCKVGSEVTVEDNDQKELSETLLNALFETGYKINSIDVTDTVSIELLVEDGITVKLGNGNFLEEKIKHLAKVLSSVEKGKKGVINLSLWTKDNPQCVFSETKEE